MSWSEGVTEEMVWLSQVARDRGIARNPVPAVLAGVFPLGSGDSYQEFLLDYEPRCLAVAEDGSSVVVGTKAGQVKVLTFIGDGWSEQPLDWSRTPRSFPETGGAPPFQPRHAIRLALYLRPDLLMVGFGGGAARLYSLADGHWRERASVEPPVDAERSGGSYYRSFFADSRVDPVVSRDKRTVGIVPLVGSEWTPLSTPSLVALIRTETGKVREVRVGHAEHWELELGDPTPSTTYLRAHGLPVDEASLVEPVDTLLRGANAYLLTSDGRVSRVEGNHLSQVARIPTPFGTPHERFDAARGGRQGIGVRSGEMYSALPWSALDSGGTVSPVWCPLPGGFAFEVMHVQDDGPPTAQEPFRMLVATAEKGLTWIGWKGAGEAPRWDRAFLRKDRSEAGLRDSEALDLRVRRVGNTKLRLFTATRDHHLCIAAFIDIQSVRRRLYACMSARRAPPARRLVKPTPGALGCDAVGAQPAGAWAHLDAQDDPGVVLWTARAAMCQDFGVDPARLLGGEGPLEAPVFGVVEFDAIPGWLRALDGGDLRELARFTDRILGAAQKEWEGWRARPSPLYRRSMAPGSPSRSVLAMRLWTQRLLRRASELRSGDPMVSREVAGRLHAAIEAHREFGDERLRQLGSLLRKWVLKGHTYRSKPTGLFNLARWNWDCGRDLDALVYATRLLRRRVDLVARTELPTPEPTPGILDLAVGAGFAVHSHHDGRIVVSAWEGNAIAELGGEEGSDPGHRFVERFGHRPHARALALSASGILFFGRQAERSEGAGRLRAVPLGCDGRPVGKEFTPAETPGEIYALHVLEPVGGGATPGSRRPAIPTHRPSGGRRRTLRGDPRLFRAR